MSAAMLKTLLLHAAEHHVAPAEILRYINDRFAAVSLDGDFASMMIVHWLPNAKLIEYASAGHGHAWLFPAAGEAPQEWPSTGWLLGIQEDSTWETDCAPIKSGSRLVLATDGNAETFNEQGEPFAGERLANLCATFQGVSLVECVNRIDEALCAHRGDAAPTDDCTVVAVEFLSGEGP